MHLYPSLWDQVHQQPLELLLFLHATSYQLRFLNLYCLVFKHFCCNIIVWRYTHINEETGIVTFVFDENIRMICLYSPISMNGKIPWNRDVFSLSYWVWMVFIPIRRSAYWTVPAYFPVKILTNSVVAIFVLIWRQYWAARHKVMNCF